MDHKVSPGRTSIEGVLSFLVWASATGGAGASIKAASTTARVAPTRAPPLLLSLKLNKSFPPYSKTQRERVLLPSPPRVDQGRRRGSKRFVARQNGSPLVRRN